MRERSSGITVTTMRTTSRMRTYPITVEIPSVHDPMAPPGMHAASAYAYAFPVETPRDQHGHLKNKMADRVVDKITRYAPNFKDIQIRHITFAPYHMNTMFGAPAGDFCHGLLHPDLMGPNRPGPKGFRDLPIGIDGLYLGGAGCHGGPGITFIPGYNAGVSGARRPRLTPRAGPPVRTSAQSAAAPPGTRRATVASMTSRSAGSSSSKRWRSSRSICSTSARPVVVTVALRSLPCRSADSPITSPGPSTATRSWPTYTPASPLSRM